MKGLGKGEGRRELGQKSSVFSARRGLNPAKTPERGGSIFPSETGNDTGSLTTDVCL